MSQNPYDPYGQNQPDPNATPGTSYGSPPVPPGQSQGSSPNYGPYTPSPPPPDQNPNYSPYNPYNPYTPPPAPPPPRPRSGGISGRVILLVVLALVLVVGGVAIGLVSYNTTQTNNANATATAHANAQTATVQNNLTATAVARVNATATFVTNPYPPNSGSLTLFDPLKDNSKGQRWDEGTYDNGNARCGFAQGSYHVTESHLFSNIDCIANASNFGNFVYQAEVTILKGDCGGLVFRADNANNKFYFFEVCQDGRFSLAANSGSSGQYLIPLTTNAAINTGLGQKNVIAVVANGNMIQLFVNTMSVDSITNTAFSQGQIGLLADNYNKGSTEVVFANVKVWTL
jgi:hypothetical protein